MQSFFGRCIFCWNELSKNELKGRGDHIIPEFMCGSLCMKDICTSCNNKLGRSADYLAIEDARIISAVFNLDLPQIKTKIRDRGEGKIVDLTDGSEGPVRFRDGRPRVVPRQVSKEMFVSDECDARIHLLNKLRKQTEHRLSEEECARIVHEELWPKYQALEPGESIHEPRLGSTLRKSPGKIVQDCKVTEGAAKRLVAKIGYEVAFLVFEPNRRTLLLPVLEQLAATAMGDAELDHIVLAYPPSTHSPVTPPPHEAQYHHQVVVYFKDSLNIIDIYFFGVVGFRLKLRGESREACGPVPHADGDIRMVSFLMSFEPGEPKRKFMFVQRSGQEDVEKNEVTGLL